MPMKFQQYSCQTRLYNDNMGCHANMDKKNFTRSHSHMKSYRLPVAAVGETTSLLQERASWDVIQSQAVSPKHRCIWAMLNEHRGFCVCNLRRGHKSVSKYFWTHRRKRREKERDGNYINTICNWILKGQVMPLDCVHSTLFQVMINQEAHCHIPTP